MFKIAICDDERHFRELIHRILEEYMGQTGMVYQIDEFQSGEELLCQGIELVKYQVVFLDVNMTGLNGIETARKIRKISEDIYIAFITAFMTYTLEGYRVNAVRYILKNTVNMPQMIFDCMDTIISKLNYVVKKKIFRFNEGMKNVSLERLLYIESRLHKLMFYIMEDELNMYTLYDTLNDIEKELAGNDFIRIHQSYLVNMKHIVKMSRNKNGRHDAVLSNGIKLGIPKARYKKVDETFIAYKGVW